ncbi:hypothetical protein DL96DRAFT_1788065 [Flagelloscypha sp. PMI_526]|nr:hypothetical protein DL96DRAFT_1788065 [Flagelloscypha sp. PMI_526]
MVFYPDNVQRASRLQQLVDSMANMQTDIKHSGDQMDERDKRIRPTIDAMLKEKGYDNIEDLIEKSTAQMTPEEKKQFEALIAAAKASKAGFDWTYFAAGILMVPEGAVLTGKMVVSIGRFVVRLSVVQSLATFFKAATSGTGSAAAAAEVGNELEKGAVEAQGIAKDGGVVGDAAQEVSRAATMMGRVATFFKVVGALGFVVTLVVGIVEIVEGAKQKEELIDAIHNSQAARLCIAFFKREATNIGQQLELVVTYLEASYGEDADPDVAAYISKKIIKNISADNAEIDLNALELELETQDKSAGGFYGGDDLSTAAVVAAAKPNAV